MRSYYTLFLLALLGCDKNPGEQNPRTATVDTANALSPEEMPWHADWIIGEDPEMVDTISTSRYYVRVMRLGALLNVNLDTAPLGTAGKGAQYTTADSLRITGLSNLETFTQTCRPSSTASGPIIALMRDTATARWGEPHSAWILDTATVRIRKIPASSVSCLIPTPD